MVIHLDGRETIFNAFQLQIEVWMRVSNFFEVRESFVCLRVNSRFARWLIVRHSFILLAEQRSPVGNPMLQSRSRTGTHGIDRMSTAATYPMKGALIVALRESRRITQFNCSSLSECLTRLRLTPLARK
jgi:hypothetical protein